MSGQRYEGIVFRPVDIQEDVDLDLDQKRDILAKVVRMETQDHWQVLGLPWNAPPDMVRTAYLDLVKVFHPDRYPGKRLGTYRARLEQIFRRLTEARDVLSQDGSRAEYARRTAPPEEVARAAARAIEDEERARERRARLERMNPQVARGSRARELLLRGRKRLEEGQPEAALGDFTTALAMDPTLAEARGLAEDARRRAAAKKGKELSDRARAAEAVGQLDTAQALADAALEASPGNALLAVHAARIAVKRGALDTALGHAEAATRTAPELGAAHEALGEVLAARGDRAEARKALQRALELDDKLEGARELLRKLRWSLFS